jgi:phospholipid/cholesterol/gamma-HCH transport system substrate-binding protein
MSRSLTSLQALVLGAIVLFALGVGGYTMWSLQERRGLGGDAFAVHAAFRDIGGVEVGTRVRIQGIDAGEVEAIEPPAVPGEPVRLRLRIAGKLRHLVAADARVQLGTEHLLSGKVIRVLPGTTNQPVTDGATLAAIESPELLDTVAQAATRLNVLLVDMESALASLRRGEGDAGKVAQDLKQATARLNSVLAKVDDTLAGVQRGEGTLGKLLKDDKLYNDLTGTLGQVHAALYEIQSGNGTLGKLVKNNEVYAEVLSSLQDVRKMVASVKQNSDAVKALPIVRSYVVDAHRELVRPECRRSRRWFREQDLFEPGRAVLTAAGKARLDTAAAWLNEQNDSNSEIVVAAFADPKLPPDYAQTLTEKQSQAVVEYLRGQHRVHRLSFWSSRSVKGVGVGVHPPDMPDTEALPSARVELLVFVPEE